MQLGSACVKLSVGFNPPKTISTKSCCFSLGKTNIAEETQQPQSSAQTGQEALEVISSLNHLQEATNSQGQEAMTTIPVSAFCVIPGVCEGSLPVCELL